MVFRAFIAAVMMILILPWGAYGAGHAGSDLRAGPHLSPEMTRISDAKGAELQARRSCRIAVLPGAPCSPEPVLPIPVSVRNAAPHPDTHALLPEDAGRGRSLAPPRAPPRMV